MNHPEYEFEIWGKPVKVISGQEWDDAYKNITTFVAEWRRTRRTKVGFWMKVANEMMADPDYLRSVIQQTFIDGHRDLYAKLFNSIRNLKGNRRRGRRSIHKQRFKH
jgi:hypothetical protein